jgi:N-methylhydantoinase A
VNFQVTAVGTIPRPRLRRFDKGAGAPSKAREVRVAEVGSAGPMRVPVFGRAALTPAAAIEGPAIIEEKTSTTVVYPGHAARVDEYLNIEITLPATEDHLR